jgi:hypothetical protein
MVTIEGSQTPGESAKGAEGEVNATVNSSDGGDCCDRQSLQVIIPPLAWQRQASTRKGPNNIFNPQREVVRIARFAGDNLVGG